MTELTSTGPLSTCAGRARFSSPLTIFAARNVWRSIFSSTLVFGSSGSAPCISICAKLEMPVSGVLTSCATPAASNPIDAIFSDICSCSSSCTRVEMSSTMSIVPAMAPSESRSGVVATFTSRRRGGSCRVGERHAIEGGAFRRLASVRTAATSKKPESNSSSSRPVDRLLVADAVELFEPTIPAHHPVVAIEYGDTVVQRLEDVLAELAHAVELIGLDA